ncbi:MAG TPA: hypothetical protein VI564_02045, partial [Candidatus Nanoarchaeia archaeon]|nr:hypothetical protein [Candidatus Nanoarchaeia archaeon]
MKKFEEKFHSDRLHFFQLASIPSVALGLASIIIGQQLAKLYGAGTAVCSIVIGNLILWLIAIAIISMVDKIHMNAIENIKGYIGKYGGIIAALVLLWAFLNWYAFQINFTIGEVSGLLPQEVAGQKDMIIRFGAVLGLFAAMLSIGGIRILHRLTVFFLPLLFFYHIYALWTAHKTVTLEGTWGLSFGAVLSTVLTVFPGYINFPTFFRHSRSKAHSILALTTLTIFITFFEISTIWMDFSLPASSLFLYPLILLLLYFLLHVTFSNMLNIYLASACWEAIIPHLGSGKEYAIIGLFGTLIYTFVQVSTPVQFMQELTNSYVAILGIVLLLAYLMRIIIQHRPRPHEKKVSLTTWLFGCAISTFYEIQHFLQGEQALLAGVNAS